MQQIKISEDEIRELHAAVMMDLALKPLVPALDKYSKGSVAQEIIHKMLRKCKDRLLRTSTKFKYISDLGSVGYV